MLWKVRALLEDRPGAMAALAAGCGERSVNILGLQIFPAADGRVLDELVLHGPDGWSSGDVERLFLAAGVEAAQVTGCAPQDLEDQPVRYLRAAQLVREEPDRLEPVLCRLLHAVPGPGQTPETTLRLDDGAGPTVILARETGFTDTEVARARELRRLVRGDGPSPATTGSGADRVPALRLGTPGDADALAAMHDRCSAQTLYFRYHAPVARLTPRMARALLLPPAGTSLLLTVDGEVVAAGMFAPDPAAEEPDTAELGLLVEDAWQQRGLGARLLRSLAQEAAGAGLETLSCLVLPENDAVLRTVDRAGLHAHARFVDGVVEYRVPVGPLRGRRRRRGNRPAMGEVTSGLVSLLHERAELREVHPAADLIDQAVRGGA